MLMVTCVLKFYALELFLEGYVHKFICLILEDNYF